MFDIIQEAKKLALKEIEKFGLPARLHFEISEEKTLDLIEKLNLNRAIALPGVYLMDLKLGEAYSQGKLKEHVKMSVEAVEEFLERFDLNEDSKKKIINCVEAHHRQSPFICKEAEACANADCYRILHPKGFIVFLGIIGKRNLKLEEALNYIEAKVDEKYKILSLDICKEELEKHYYQFKEIIRLAR